MRQGQQNRRGRGRNNNGGGSSGGGGGGNHNRKGQNPLTRSFESTGPDVKLRGTPAHIAEKYITLARDAQSSGDPVLAENYLQHAEHYNRIIMTYREQQIAQGGGGDLQNGQGRPRPAGFGEPVSMNDDFGDEDGEFSDQGQPQQNYSQPQHRSEGQPRHNDGPRYDDRGPRNDDRGPRNDGGGRFNRDRGDRGDRDGNRGGAVISRIEVTAGIVEIAAVTGTTASSGLNGQTAATVRTVEIGRNASIVRIAATAPSASNA